MATRHPDSKEDDHSRHPPPGGGVNLPQHLQSVHVDHHPLGWDHIPLSRYAELIERIAQHRPRASFLLVSNHVSSLHQLRAMLPSHIRVVAPEPSPTEAAEAAAGFAGRREEEVLSAAAEWLALASCDLVVGGQGSAYSLTASLRGGGLGIVLAPGSGTALVSTGELEFLDPSYLTHRQYHTRRCTDDSELRAWGLGELVWCVDPGEGGAEEGGNPSPAHLPAAPRRLHIGRTTTAGTLETGSNATGWTVVDAVPGPGVVQVGDMSSLPFDAASFDLVYASHCLEHAPWERVETTLREWRRVLSPGGTLCVAVPDMVALSKLVASPDNTADDDLQLMYVLYGAQRDAHDYHRAGFTERLLVTLLRNRGFCGVRRVSELPYFPADSTRLQIAGRAISLNLNAVAC